MRIGLIAISAGGLMVLIGVALGSVLARIIFGRRGDRPRLRARENRHVQPLALAGDNAPQRARTTQKETHHER